MLAHEAQTAVRPASRPGGGGAIPARALTIARCTTKDQRRTAASFVNEHHSYIKWADRPSRKLYWLLYENGRLVGVWGLSSAFARPRHVRDFMDRHGLAFNNMANNIVFCLHGALHPNAGSIFLRLCRRDAVRWWAERYGDNLKAIQTFVLPPRTGAVYRSDNWTHIGQTRGGVTMTTRTLYGEDRDNPKAERRVFKNGETKYLLREYARTEPKDIFVVLV